MSECTALATKVEVRKLSKKIDQKLDESAKNIFAKNSEVQQIDREVNTNSNQIEVNKASIGGFGSQLGSVSSTAGLGVALGLQAGSKAAKNQNAIGYVASRTSAALGKTASLGSLIAKAFVAISAIISLMGTLATAVAVAKLSAAVYRLDKLAKNNEKVAKENRRIAEENSKVNKLQDRAITINRETNLRQQKEIDKINKLQAAQQEQLARQNERIINFERVTEEKIQAVTQQINQFKTETNLEITKLRKAIDERDGKISELSKGYQDSQATIKQLQKNDSQQNKNIDSLTSKTSSLETQVKDIKKQEGNREPTTVTLDNREVIKRVRSLDTKVTNFGTDIQTLKGSQVKLQSSLDGTNNKFKQGLEVSSKLSSGDITKFKEGLKVNSRLEKSEIPKLKQQQTKQQSEITQLKQNSDNQVDNQQVANINSRLDKTNQKLDKLPDLKDISLAVAGLDILRQIKDKAGKTTCQAPTLIPPVAAQAKATNTTLLSFQAANTIQTTAIQRTVNVTKNVVTHGTHGLQAIKNAADVAWKATRMDKVLNYLNLAFTIHNGMQLSTNLAGSLGDILSGILNNSISFLKNEEFQEININETLGTTIENLLKRIIGEENYTGASENLKKYNRVVNAASNTIHSIMSIQAGLAEGLETIGNYTGRIGNALKKSGAVLENSYSWMSEKVSVKTGRLGSIQRVVNGLETAENVGSDIQNATSEFREAQTTVSDIGNQFNSVKSEFTSKETEKTTTESTTKANSQGAQPQLTDFVRDPVE